MSSRKKLVVSLAVVALVIVAAVVAVVGVLAANQQTIQSGVYITFTAVDIDGAVSAEYKVQSKTLQGFDSVDDDAAGKVTFKAEDTQVSGAMTLGTLEQPIAITGRDDAVFIQFTFTRSSKDYTVNAVFSNADTLYKVEALMEDGSWAALTGSATQVLTGVDAENGTVLVVKITPKDLAFDITKDQLAALQATPQISFNLNAKAA